MSDREFDRDIIILVLSLMYLFSIFSLAGFCINWNKSKVKGYFAGIFICCLLLLIPFLMYIALSSPSWSFIFYLLISPMRIIVEYWEKTQFIIFPLISFYTLFGTIGLFRHQYKTQKICILKGLFLGQVIFSIIYVLWFTIGLYFQTLHLGVYKIE